MKKIQYITLLLMVCGTLSAQQFPFMEGYSINPFSISPAFAGIQNNKTLFIDYRSDWAGLGGGPTTYQLSYNDKVSKNVGLGGRFIYDKTDIFKQTLIVGSYSYEVKFADKHRINFGLSAGLYKNSIDLVKYFNNSDYVTDAALISGLEKSKFKFVSDVSALYRLGNFESGILFSNLMFGTIKYSTSEVTYKPFMNYMAHAAYNYQASERWDIKPFVLWRAGQHVPGMVEMAATATYNKKVWATALMRTAGVWGFGAGVQLFDGILVNYSYNFSSGVALNTFGSHQITLGIKLFRASPKIPKAAAPAVIEAPVEPELAKISGTITRKSDNKPVSGTMTVLENSTEIQKTIVNNGTFNLDLKSGKTYKLDMSSDNYPTVSKTVELPVNKSLNNINFEVEYVSAVKGTVTDQATGAGVNSTIIISKNGVVEQTISANGLYNLKLQQGAVYQLEYKAEGYYNKKVNADLSKEDFAEVNIQLEKIKKEAFNLGAINFESGKSVISSSSLPVLDEFIVRLKDNPDLKFEISGHTDNVGSPVSNRKISGARAQSCVDYMISKGIAADRLKPVGYGQDQPLVPNTTQENKAKNRRVEANILK